MFNNKPVVCVPNSRSCRRFPREQKKAARRTGDSNRRSIGSYALTTARLSFWFHPRSKLWRSAIPARTPLGCRWSRAWRRGGRARYRASSGWRVREGAEPEVRARAGGVARDGSSAVAPGAVACDLWPLQGETRGRPAMPERANERTAYHNGRFVPEREVLVPFRDRGLPLRRRRLRHDPDVPPPALQAPRARGAALPFAEGAAHRPGHAAGRDGRGHRRRCWGATGTCSAPTTTTGCRSGSAAGRARVRGAPSGRGPPSSSSARRCRSPSGRGCSATDPRRRARHAPHPPDALTPRAKTHNYLNLVLAEQEAHSLDPEAWAVLLDAHGNLCEGLGSNLFLVRDGMLLTPRERLVLPGVSRRTVIELAAGSGSLRGARPRPLRRLHRGRGVPDVDKPVPVPGSQRQRQPDRRRGRAVPGRLGTAEPAPRRRLRRPGRLRFRGAVPAPPRLRRPERAPGPSTTSTRPRS
jgi:hypothetical protein